MSSAARHPSEPVKSTNFACDHYESAPGDKHCRHYVQGGFCAKPDKGMCVEWLKANGKPSEAKPPVPKVSTDLFGKPLPNLPAKKQAKPKPIVTEKWTAIIEQPASVEPRCGLTKDDIESFRALGLEVCLRSDDCGDVWLVPTYTGLPRKEITPEHLATLASALDVFPGSRIVAFDKKPPAEPANEGSLHEPVQE